MLNNSIVILHGLIEFIKCVITRINGFRFKLYLSINWKELKGLNYNFKNLIRSKIELSYMNIKV